MQYWLFRADITLVNSWAGEGCLRFIAALMCNSGALLRLRDFDPILRITPLFRTRFRREAQSAGRLNHPAIVSIYDTGEEHDATGASIPFIVMELVEGRSLRQRAARGRESTTLAST